MKKNFQSIPFLKFLLKKRQEENCALSINNRSAINSFQIDWFPVVPVPVHHLQNIKENEFEQSGKENKFQIYEYKRPGSGYLILQLLLGGYLGPTLDKMTS